MAFIVHAEPHYQNVSEGSTTRLSCSSKINCSDWNFTPDRGGNAEELVSHCKLASTENHYKTVEVEPGIIDLVIPNATQSHAGTYTCSGNNGLAGSERNSIILKVIPTQGILVMCISLKLIKEEL